MQHQDLLQRLVASWSICVKQGLGGVVAGINNEPWHKQGTYALQVGTDQTRVYRQTVSKAGSSNLAWNSTGLGANEIRSFPGSSPTLRE